jgi:hypothetical protein
VSLATFVDWVKGEAAEGITSFALPLDTNGDEARATAFIPNEVYLEIRVRQIWLTRQRELWREFQPFAAVVSEFIHRGEQRMLPVMLGSSQLSGKLALISDRDAIEIRNLRVGGPTPFEGDDVTLLLALFRTKTEDWLGRTLGVVETIAVAVGGSALVAAKPVAEALVGAVTQFLGQQQLELRCGQHQSWSSPQDPGDPQSTELRPMHYVVMRSPVGRIAVPEREFVVVDGRLHRIGGVEPVPHTEHDFMLLSIEPRKVRDDYKKLPFYALWQQTQQHVVDGDTAAAERAWRRTAGALYSDDLTGPHQQQLYTEYRQRYEALIERFALAEAHGFRGRQEHVALAIDEQDPAEILLRPVP